MVIASADYCRRIPKLPKIMTIVQTFTKSEDAHLAASLLASEGLDPSVFDDSAYGNALGASANAIRIEVPNSQAEEAKRILEARR